MSQPPPPRYRIIERDGRLVTIDTWADKTADKWVPSMRGSPPTPKPPHYMDKLVATLLPTGRSGAALLTRFLDTLGEDMRG